MKHHKKGRTFGRTRNQRKSLLAALVRSLINKEKMVTTEAKAKSLRPVIEKVVTRAKNNDLATKRELAAFLNDKTLKKVTEVISSRYRQRSGGYTRIIKMAPRKSDGSAMALIEFIK